MMKRFEKSASVSDSPRADGPGGGVLFWGMRILFSACLIIMGLAGPLVLIVAGLGDGSPAPVIFGTLVLGLVFGVGAMVFA